MPATTMPSASSKDLLGQLLSVVCVVHCLAAPLVVSSLPAAASFFGGFHPLLLVGVIAVAAWAFVPGVRQHGVRGVLVVALLGIGCLALAALAFEDAWAVETAVSALGAVLMVSAHWWNRRLLLTSRTASAP